MSQGKDLMKAAKTSENIWIMTEILIDHGQDKKVRLMTKSLYAPKDRNMITYPLRQMYKAEHMYGSVSLVEVGARL